MDRRDFLKSAAALGSLAGVAGIPGCATTGLPTAAAPAVPSVDMDSYLAQLDGAMDAIHRESFFGDLVRAGTPTGGVVDTALLEQRERLSRKILRTLTLAGMFADLNEHDRAHPGMQARLWSAAAEIDATMEETSGALTALSTEDRGTLRRQLRREPTLIGRVGDALDAKAALIQAPAKRRRHLRALVGQVGWRMREQDPSVLIDEFADTYQRAKRHAERSAQSAQSTPATAPLTAEETLPTLEVSGASSPQLGVVAETPRPREGRGQSRVNGGLITLGIGVGLGGIGGLLLVAGASSGGILNSGAGVAGLVLITIGALGLIAGLITLIVGAVMNSNDPGAVTNSTDPHAD